MLIAFKPRSLPESFIESKCPNIQILHIFTTVGPSLPFQIRFISILGYAKLDYIRLHYVNYFFCI